MAMRYGYFDSEITGVDSEGMPIFDRAETSELFRLLFAKLLTNGVLAKPADCFQVLAGDTGLTVKVRPGFGLINGAFAYDAAESTYELATAPTQYSRIDRVVLRVNYRDRLCEIIIKTGTAASSPVAPELIRPTSGDYYELSLATIRISTNMATITQSAITDTRPDSSVCGYITQFIDSIDTSVFFAQFNAFYEEFVERSEASYDDYQNAFNAWFATVQDLLDEDVAGHLINITTDHEKRLTELLADIGEDRERLDGLDDLTDILTHHGAGLHNALYRGKYLGDSLTAAQSAAIRAGTFEDLYIGDYWTIGGVNYRIADFDYFYRAGDTECTTHHVVIVPDTNLDNQKMNDSNITTGGYTGSKMYTNYMATAKNKIIAAFGSGHILNHREYLTNAVANGRPSGGAWFDSTVELMSEAMCYGGTFLEPVSDGSTTPAKFSVACKQLNLFRHRPDMISNRQTFWLRNVVSATAFASVTAVGDAHSNDASYFIGVRPAFPIY